MTPNHDFTNAKAGDPIHTVEWGEAIIHEILSVDDYPIKAKFGGRTESFTMDGKYRINDVGPTAFTEPIKVVPASYESFTEQEMMVWNDDIEQARQRVVFAKNRGQFIAYNKTTFIRDIDGSEDIINWKNALPIAEWEAKVKESKNQQEITKIENQIAELQAKLEKLKESMK